MLVPSFYQITWKIKCVFHKWAMASVLMHMTSSSRSEIWTVNSVNMRYSEESEWWWSWRINIIHTISRNGTAFSLWVMLPSFGENIWLKTITNSYWDVALAQRNMSLLSGLPAWPLLNLSTCPILKTDLFCYFIFLMVVLFVRCHSHLLSRKLLGFLSSFKILEISWRIHLWFSYS